MDRWPHDIPPSSGEDVEHRLRGLGVHERQILCLLDRRLDRPRPLLGRRDRYIKLYSIERTDIGRHHIDGPDLDLLDPLVYFVPIVALHLPSSSMI